MMMTTQMLQSDVCFLCCGKHLSLNATGLAVMIVLLLRSSRAWKNFWQCWREQDEPVPTALEAAMQDSDRRFSVGIQSCSCLHQFVQGLHNLFRQGKAECFPIHIKRNLSIKWA
ncbi:uncharacterized protein LJ206_008933 [Theristicus caerulescens]